MMMEKEKVCCELSQVGASLENQSYELNRKLVELRTKMQELSGAHQPVRRKSIEAPKKQEQQVKKEDPNQEVCKACNDSLFKFEITIPSCGKHSYHVKCLNDKKECPECSGGKELPESMECKLCMDKHREILFIPCKHMCTCMNCAMTITNCPICRSLIQEKIKVYLS